MLTITAAALIAKFTAEIAPAAVAKYVAELEAVEALVPKRTKLSDEDLYAALSMAAELAYNRVNGMIWAFLGSEGVPTGSLDYGDPAIQLRSEAFDGCSAQFPTNTRSRVWAAEKALRNTVRGRENKVAREKNAPARAADAAEAALYSVGEEVQVHAFGHWYAGTVKSFNRNGRAVVTYTSGTGVTRDKTVSADLIRKAQ